jgi:hypothetical protein
MAGGGRGVLQGLQAGSTKDYRSAHKGFYKTAVREPMAGLPGELSGLFDIGRVGWPAPLRPSLGHKAGPGHA